MANIQNLQEKVQKATEKVEKCKATIERHHKIMNNKISKLIKKGVDLTGLTKEEIEEIQNEYRQKDQELTWEMYDVKSKLDDIKGAHKKLEEAERVLDGHKEKLAVEINRDKFLNENAPQVIKDFLQQWKEKAYDWHIHRYEAYQNFKKKLNKEEEEAKAEIGVQKGFFPNRAQEKALKELGLDYSSIQARKAHFAGGAVLTMDTYYKEEERLAWLEKTLESERKFKMLDLIHRINGAVGEITDASNLKLGAEGQINGFIIGKDGKAKVETIGAGGYNIQCFHYRTLINTIK